MSSSATNYRSESLSLNLSELGIDFLNILVEIVVVRRAHGGDGGAT